ncbi:MAG: GGDEF domain-containing protein, partial [Microthrixaceae bacterium]
MISPRFPAAEADRIDSLRALGLLDTLPEDRFDRITRLAARIFDVPIALVTLVDSDRQ